MLVLLYKLIYRASKHHNNNIAIEEYDEKRHQRQHNEKWLSSAATYNLAKNSYRMDVASADKSVKRRRQKRGAGDGRRARAIVACSNRHGSSNIVGIAANGISISGRKR
jgi:hypothetical protein